MLKHQNDVKQFIPVGVLTTMAFVFVLIISSWLAPQSFSEEERLRSVLLQILVVAGTPLLVVRITGLKLQNIFKLRLISSSHFFFAILLGVFIIPWLEETLHFQSQYSEKVFLYEQLTQKWIQSSSGWNLVWILLSMAVIPSVCEELFFRGLILNLLVRSGNYTLAIIISSLMFGIFHRNLVLILPATLAGVLLAVLVTRSGSLLTAMASHFMVNATTILALHFGIAAVFPWLGKTLHVPLHILIFSGLAILFLIWKLKNTEVTTK